MRAKLKMGFEQRQLPKRYPRRFQEDPEVKALRLAEQPKHRFCVRVFGRQVTPWRTRREDVELDAIRAGHASRYEAGGPIYMTVPAWIDRRPV